MSVSILNIFDFWFYTQKKNWIKNNKIFTGDANCISYETWKQRILNVDPWQPSISSPKQHLLARKITYLWWDSKGIFVLKMTATWTSCYYAMLNWAFCSFEWCIGKQKTYFWSKEVKQWFSCMTVSSFMLAI